MKFSEIAFIVLMAVASRAVPAAAGTCMSATAHPSGPNCKTVPGSVFLIRSPGDAFSVLDGQGSADDPDAAASGGAFSDMAIYENGPADLSGNHPVPGDPEPASWELMMFGVGGMGAALRTWRRRSIPA